MVRNKNNLLDDKGFVRERGFSKLISLFYEIIEKRGWEFFCSHKAPGFFALPREFYANMVGMREDSVYVRGVWVPFGHKRICHTPIPNPTRLANPNRFRGAKPYTGTPCYFFLIIFFYQQSFIIYK